MLIGLGELDEGTSVLHGGRRQYTVTEIQDVSRWAGFLHDFGNDDISQKPGPAFSHRPPDDTDPVQAGNALDRRGAVIQHHCVLCLGKKQPALDQNAENMGDKTEGENARRHWAKGDGERQ